ncbi:hypothetical protein NIES4075_16930 [Tolypothrix sp. NIES-4075]|nr:hypothetical protein NIES4075_16930 [Tolypothrix sp. NIES-4075]
MGRWKDKGEGGMGGKNYRERRRCGGSYAEGNSGSTPTSVTVRAASPRVGNKGLRPRLNTVQSLPLGGV